MLLAIAIQKWESVALVWTLFPRTLFGVFASEFECSECSGLNNRRKLAAKLSSIGGNDHLLLQVIDGNLLTCSHAMANG